MANPMASVAKPIALKTGVKAPKTVAKPLSDVLSATYALLIKTHVYHWNVTGPLFYGLHHLTDEQYNDLFQATDVIAERIRALGQLAPLTADEITSTGRKIAAAGKISAQEMVADLIKDHEALATMLHELIETADSHKDPVTADLATVRSSFHEKAIWMLSALLAD